MAFNVTTTVEFLNDVAAFYLVVYNILSLMSTVIWWEKNTNPLNMVLFSLSRSFSHSVFRLRNVLIALFDQRPFHSILSS